MVAYQTTINGYSQVMVTNTGTGEIDQLTNNQDNNFSPTIDGTGAHVAFQGNVAGFTQLFLSTQVSGAVGGTTDIAISVESVETKKVFSTRIVAYR